MGFYTYLPLNWVHKPHFQWSTVGWKRNQNLGYNLFQYFLIFLLTVFTNLLAPSLGSFSTCLLIVQNKDQAKNPRGLLCIIPYKIQVNVLVLKELFHSCYSLFTLCMYFQQQLTPRIFVADFRNGSGWDHWSNVFQPCSSSWGVWIRDPDSCVSSIGVKLAWAKGSWILSWVPVFCVSTRD